MNWSQLLSLKRNGDKNPRPRAGQDEMRLGFEVDYDRIIFSQPFRSLQDKTQVIPLSQTGFVHTRLTHSLEVSVVGRSLGRMAGAQIIEKHPELLQLGYRFQDFGAIVAAAALAHDIGNPPFGHSGEKAIGDYFKTGQGAGYLDTLSRKQQEDLHRYEGNANGYRLLNMDAPGTPGRLRLSYATLGAFTKYPKESLPYRPTTHISQKKFGVFQSNIAHFEDVATSMGMVAAGGVAAYHRHPLTYLVEAADDICYTIIDFEDGINLGWIAEDHALEQLIKLVKSTIKNETYHKLENTAARLSYLRSLAINALIKDCVRVFMEKEDQILDGRLEKSLMDYSIFKPQIDDILSITIEKVYQNPEVLHKEIGGYKVLQDILSSLLRATMNRRNGSCTSIDYLILKACPELNASLTSDYEVILDTCGYVASLTDSRAMALFKIINGDL
ncbi:MAG: dNTP triphosphohydrolase [Nonlabens sp.]